MALAFIPVYIEYVGMEAYGLIGVFAILQAWFGLLDLGMTPTLSREMARFTGGSHTPSSIRNLLRSIEAIAIVVALLFTLVMSLASPWLASSWLKSEGLSNAVDAQAIVIMSAVTTLRFLEGIYRSCLIGLQHQVLYNVLNSAMATIRAAGAIAVLAWVSPTIGAFFLWQGAVSTATLMIMAFAVYCKLPRTGHRARVSFEAIRGVLQFASGMLHITILGLILTQVDKVLLSKILPLSDFGIYTLASLVAGALFMVAAPISQAWLPRLTQLHEQSKPDALVLAYHQGSQLITAVFVSASIVLIMFSETILTTWTQDAELAEQTEPLLKLLAFGNLLNGLMWIPYQAQLAAGWTSLAIRINFVAILVIVPAVILVTPHYGSLGAAWIWVSLNAAYVFIGIGLMHRRILVREKMEWYLEDVGTPALAATIVATAIHALAATIDTTTANIVAIAMAAILTPLAAALAGKHTRKEIRKIVALALPTQPGSHDPH